MTADATPLAYAAAPRVPGVRSRFVPDVNGLTMHVLEAGDPDDPTVVLLHGFPELAFSWRHQLVALAAAGWHVVAPDQRGYGCTTGWGSGYDTDLVPFRQFHLAMDVVALVRALGRDDVAAVVGHDFGSPVAAWCALIRPDVFRSVVLMSAPFGGAPSIGRSPQPDIDAALAELDPPRRHYQRYYSTPQADADMHRPAMGLHAFLRAYYHVKSADWPANRPHPLGMFGAAALAELPHYYVMRFGAAMPDVVASDAPTPEDIAACRWLPDTDLAVYTAEYQRLGFQGGLNWYRCVTDPVHLVELRIYDGARIEAPAGYIAGAADWGTFQTPGAFERMQRTACADLRSVHLVPGAGHWVQQEQPDATNALLLDFLRRAAAG